MLTLSRCRILILALRSEYTGGKESNGRTAGGSKNTLFIRCNSLRREGVGVFDPNKVHDYVTPEGRVDETEDLWGSIVALINKTARNSLIVL